MSVISFLLRSIRALYHSGLTKYHYYKKLGYYPPRGIDISEISAISLGQNFSISEYCSLYCQDPEKGSQLVIGQNVALNRNVMINADNGGKIFIGDNVLMGPNVVIRAANHNFSNPSKSIRAQGHKAGTIIIENNVWIAANVVILPNVKIGTGSVVAAGAVVNKDVTPGSVYGGIPAKKISSI